MRQGVIYKFTNKVNGKVYIGQTISESTRKRAHFASAYKENSRDYNSSFKRAIRKYGKEAFMYDVLFRSKHTENIGALFRVLNALEIAYISFYNSSIKGYNDSPGGRMTKGCLVSDSTRKKQSEAQRIIQNRPEIIKSKSLKMSGSNNPMFGISLKGKLSPRFGTKLSKERIASLIESRKGKSHPHTDEAKEKIRQKIIGIKRSEETKQKLRDYFTGRKNALRSKRVLQYTLEGKFVREWDSISEPQEIFKTKHIGCNCSGKRDQAGGFLWRYKESDDYPLKIERFLKSGCRRIRQLDLQGNIIKEFDSIREASKDTKIRYTGITEVLSGRQHKSGGYKWEYID